MHILDLSSIFFCLKVDCFTFRIITKASLHYDVALRRWAAFLCAILRLDGCWDFIGAFSISLRVGLELLKVNSSSSVLSRIREEVLRVSQHEEWRERK